MKYKIIILFLFLISLLSFSQVNALTKDLPLLGKVIYLDAGHGGRDSGANYAGIYEKDLNLELTKVLANTLGEKGAIVYLTRDGDYDLSDNKYNRKRSDLSNRAKLINDSHCDMYLSIHLNASTESSSLRGLQVFYDKRNPNNKELANTMYNTIKTRMTTIREVKEDNNYYMYKQIKVPGILIEAGFLSNPDDRYLLKQPTYQQKISKLITKGVENYFQNKKNIVY